MPDQSTATTLPVVEFDHHDRSITDAEMRDRYKSIRSRCPVAHVDGYGGFVLVTGYEAVRSVVTDTSFLSGDGIFLPASGLPPVPALEYDGAEHEHWRGLMGDLLSPAAVRELDPMVREVVNHQIDTFAGRGEVDLVSDFAHPVPGIVIGRLVGLDMEASLTSQELADDLFAAIGTPGFEEAMGAFAGFTLGQLAQRRAEPGDDYLSELASGSYKGVEITDEVALQLFIALLGGGHHSTSSGLSGLLAHVLGSDELRTLALDDSRACARIIDESLRLTTPLQLFARTASQDAEVTGCPITAGSRVLVNYAAANRDPAEFDRPEDFVGDRKRNRHLAFGAGLHVCVGQHLARLELRIGLTRLLERLPDVRLAGEPVTDGLVTGQLVRLRSLPATFTPVES